MIYLDHAAATPVSARVLEAMMPYFSDEFFNPSAAYLPAKKVAADYEAAKATIAHAIGAKGSDIIVTAGATEANNLAFSCIGLLEKQEFSVCGSLRAERISQSLAETAPELPVPYSSREASQNSLGLAQCTQKTLVSPCILYLITEHDSVRKVAEHYGGEAIRVLRNGVVDLDDLRAKISDETRLISISLVNNEIGVIQPLAEVSAIIREVRLDRMKRGIRTPLYLHSDASQALNLLDVNVARLGVDLMTLNAAKIYGPKGVGALYVAHGVKLAPVVYGGGQENGLRSGTENVPGTIGFATAASEAKKHLVLNRKKYAEWKKIFLGELDPETGFQLIHLRKSEQGSLAKTLDNFVVLCYNGIDAERLVFLLEDKGVYVSTGAACAASKGVRSHVLAAIGLSDSEIAGSLRITFGETNDTEQVREAAKILNEVVTAERKRIGAAA